MGLKDKIVRALALRWLRGELKDLRGNDRETTMGKVLKFLDGWKLVIFVVLTFATKMWDGAHNGHAGDILGNILNVMGWLPGAQSGFTTEGIAVAATSALGLWAFLSKLYKAGKQIQAGSSVSGALSTEGYVTKYVNDAMAAKKVDPPVVN